MEALFGFAVGYLLGTQAGRDGVDNLVRAWTEIQASPEFKALLSAGTATASGLIGRFAREGRGVLGSLAADQAGKLLENRLRVA